ncbi:MAG: hypothetical protein GEV13_28455 [Rhodospirillales bacterium]|nr:hypothetical protein [Rhodospirillales bacterium]
MNNASNVIAFRPRSTRNTRPAIPRRNPDFDMLTALVIRDRRRRGEIDPDTAATFLAAIEAPQ